MKYYVFIYFFSEIYGYHITQEIINGFSGLKNIKAM